MPYLHRPTASLLSETVKPIGKRHLEIRQRVSCPQQHRHLHYSVETWLFFPHSLQINRWSYSPTDYQQSLKNYIRLGVPVRTLESVLIGLEKGAAQKEEEDRSPNGTETSSLQGSDMLTACFENLDAVLRENTSEARARYEDSLKLFCVAYRVSLQRRKKDVLALEDLGERSRAALELARLTQAGLKRYRSLLRLKAAQAQPLMRAPAFQFCDEYLSIMTTRVLAELVRCLSMTHTCPTQLLASYGAQRAYRRTFYPDSMPIPGQDNELPLFRWSVLKKYVDMPLYLTIQRSSGNSLLVHTLYSITAALAMSAALGTSFVWQDFEGLSTPLFVIIVVSYILRERVKEVFNGKLFKVFRRWIPDRLLYICDGYSRRLGRCAESFHFVDWEKIPKEVRKIRNRTHFVDILNAFHSEDILYYSKRIDIKALPDPFREGRHLLMDISRFDISDFLRHADEVSDEPQDGAEERLLVGDKVYHVDMVRKISHGCGTDFERFRIVLTHEGIRRIDEVESSWKDDMPTTETDTLTEDATPENANTKKD